MPSLKLLILFLPLLTFFGCNSEPTLTTYAEDLALLRKHANVLELKSPDGQARLAIVPDFQGKVMMSTAFGLNGASNGWFDREALSNGKLAGVGGEDRVWISLLGS